MYRPMRAQLVGSSWADEHKLQMEIQQLFCLWPTKFVHKMLAWHLPHQLAAELVLVGVSAAVLLYSLLPWGKNQWLRTHGVILCGYYAVGGLVYDELEGWGLLDTTYFLTVTITTVGYGDFCPETPEGKLFTVVWAGVVALFVLLVVFLATGTPPGAPDGALAD